MKPILSTIHTLRLWIVLIVVFLFPIFFLPVTPDFYQMNKLYLVMASSLVLFALFVIESALEGKISLSFTNTTKGLLLLAVAAVATTLLGTPNIIESFLSPVGVLLFISAFLFILFAQVNQKDEKSIKLALLLSLAILAVVAVYHGLGITKTLVGKFVFLNDPNWSPSGNMQVALVLFLASMPLFLQMIVAGRMKKGADRVTAMAIPLVGLVVVVAGALVAGYTVLLKYPLTNLSVPVSIQVLTNAWRQTKHMLFGTGLASYMSAFSAGKPVSFNQTSAWNTYFMQAGGLFWHIATTNGIIGLGALVVAWILPILVYLKKGFSNAKQHWGILGSYLVLTLLMLVVPPALPFVLFWIALLLCMEGTQQPMQTTYTIASYVAKTSFILFSMAMLAVLGYLFGRSYAAYVSMYQSLKAVDRRDGTAAYQWASRSLKENPLLPGSHMYFSQINLELAKALATKDKVTDEDKTTITSLIAQSISEAKATIASDPTSPVGWVNLARIYETLIPIAQSADQWAIASYQQAAIYDPNNPLLRFALGTVSVTRKDLDAALNYFAQAAQLKPDFANAYYNLAYVFKLKDDIPNETQMLQKTLTLMARDSTDYTKVMNELADLDRQKAASAAAQPNKAPPAGGPALTTPPSGKPIIVPPIALPTAAAK